MKNISNIDIINVIILAEFTVIIFVLFYFVYRLLAFIKTSGIVYSKEPALNTLHQATQTDICFPQEMYRKQATTTNNTQPIPMESNYVEIDFDYDSPTFNSSHV